MQIEPGLISVRTYTYIFICICICICVCTILQGGRCQGCRKVQPLYFRWLEGGETVGRDLRGESRPTECSPPPMPHNTNANIDTNANANADANTNTNAITHLFTSKNLRGW